MWVNNTQQKLSNKLTLLGGWSWCDFWWAASTWSCAHKYHRRIDPRLGCQNVDSAHASSDNFGPRMIWSIASRRTFLCCKKTFVFDRVLKLSMVYLRLFPSSPRHLVLYETLSFSSRPTVISGSFDHIMEQRLHLYCSNQIRQIVIDEVFGIVKNKFLAHHRSEVLISLQAPHTCRISCVQVINTLLANQGRTSFTIDYLKIVHDLLNYPIAKSITNLYSWNQENSLPNFAMPWKRWKISHRTFRF